MTSRPIMIIAGANRPDSNAMRLARAIAAHYSRQSVAADLFSLSQMPAEIFDPAAYARKPPAFLAIQQQVLDAAGLHVITPEYNGSFPGILKYFIDMLKFPESFEHKPVAFVGEAAGQWGALRAVEQLQMIFSYRNAHTFPNRVFIAAVREKFDAAGNLDPTIDERLAKQTAGFAEFCHRLARPQQ